MTIAVGLVNGVLATTAIAKTILHDKWLLDSIPMGRFGDHMEEGSNPVHGLRLSRTAFRGNRRSYIVFSCKRTF